MDIEKKMFYKTWGIGYSITFLSLPLSIVVARVLSPWVRSEMIYILMNAVHVFLLTVLVIGLWPERTQPVFCIDKNLACSYGQQSDILLVAKEMEQHQPRT